MKTINESELDVALNKLETIRKISADCIREMEDPLIKIMCTAILEVIDE